MKNRKSTYSRILYGICFTVILTGCMAKVSGTSNGYSDNTAIYPRSYPVTSVPYAREASVSSPVHQPQPSPTSQVVSSSPSEIVQDAPLTHNAVTSNVSLVERVQIIQSLRKDGVITQEEEKRLILRAIEQERHP